MWLCDVITIRKNVLNPNTKHVYNLNIDQPIIICIILIYIYSNEFLLSSITTTFYINLFYSTLQQNTIQEISIGSEKFHETVIIIYFRKDER